MTRRSKSAARASAIAGKDIRAEVAHALAQLETLEAEQTEFRATFERAKAASDADLQTLHSRIEVADRENDRLRAEVIALHEAHATATGETATAHGVLTGLQAQHTQAVQRIANLERELAGTTAQAKADRLAETTRADALAFQAQILARTLDTQQQEAARRFADLTAQHEHTRGELTLTAEELARARENARQAQARNDGLAAEILARDQLCIALRRESDARQQQIEAGETARARVEERLRDAERRMAEAEHAAALGDLRQQAWQDSVAGRFGLLLLRARRYWWVLRRKFARSSPNPLFDEAFYLAGNPDVAIGGRDPYRHYLDHGAREGRDPNPLFATVWYLKNNPDVAASGVNPLVHFHETGAAQLRDPHPDFSTRAWREAHPEAAASGVNPLEHVLRARENGA